MYKFIKYKLKVESNKRLISNFISLAVLQGASYILPLITLPYLVRVLGPERFGLVAFATSTVAYFQVITDYGFDLSATRHVSINRDNNENLIEIFSSVIAIKFILMFVSLILLSIIIFSFEKFSVNWKIYYLTFGMVLGQILFPVWLFQGLENMKYITVLNIVAKLIFTVAIFVVVKTENDYLYVPLLNSIGILIAGISGFVISIKMLNVKFSYRKILLKKYAISSFPIFGSVVSSSILYNSPALLLGTLTNYHIVGLYSAAEKIIYAIRSFLYIFHQTVFPRLSKLYYDNINKYFYLWKTFFLVIVIVSFSVAIICNIFSETITNVIFGSNFSESGEIFKILSITIMTYSIYTMLGLESLIITGHTKQLVYSQIIPIIIYLIISPFVLNYLSIIPFVFCLIIAEFMIIIIRLFFLNMNGFFSLNKKYDK